eukprot:1157619-Pelagomonas_calceolata.AAC.37
MVMRMVPPSEWLAMNLRGAVTVPRLTRFRPPICALIPINSSQRQLGGTCRRLRVAVTGAKGTDRHTSARWMEEGRGR